MNGVTTKPTQAINKKAAGTLKTMTRYSRTAEDVDLSEEAELRRSQRDLVQRRLVAAEDRVQDARGRVYFI